MRCRKVGPKSLTAVLAITLASLAPACHGLTGKQKAWSMFEAAAKSTHTTERAVGIRALGLLPNDPRACKLAEAALEDPKPQVRMAAANALGQMHSLASIPKIEKLLKDDKLAVVVTAAHVLHEMKDDASAGPVYYEILTGERKSEGLVAKQLDTLQNPHELLRIGSEVGIGFIPYAGIGWDAWHYTHPADPNPVRAVAATMLAKNPDPKVGKALVDATKDKNWIVRAAAIEAIAQRGDPALEKDIEYSFFDSNAHVRYTTAAAVIRLTAVEERGRRVTKHAAATPILASEK